MRSKVLAVLFAAVLIATPFLQPGQAQAWGNSSSGTVADVCQPSHLSEWDWPKDIRQTGTAKVGWTTFNAETDSYVIMSTDEKFGDTPTHGMSNANHGVPSKPIYSWTLMVPNTRTAKIIFEKNAAGTEYQMRASTGSLQFYTIMDVPPSTYGSDYTAYIIGPGNNFMTTFSTPVKCFENAVNVQYDGSWVGIQPNGRTPAYAVNPADRECKALELGCWMYKIFDNIGDGFNAVIQGLVTAITYLFVPKSTDLTTVFTNLSTALTNQLGFLSWTVSWVISFFSAFTGTSACTTSSCVLALGDFMGAPTNYNFAWPAQNFGTMWTLFTTFLRAATVLGLLMAFRARLLAVLAK